MMFDKTGMTKYETVTLIISTIAVLIPFVQMIWRKWIIKAKLNHYHTGFGYLFINRSGSYIQIQSVFEASNRPISIKMISLHIRRLQDNQQRNYVWSTFTSPANMQFVGRYALSTEIAHPFRIEEDQVQCAFTEYGEKNQNAYRILTPCFEALSCIAKEYLLQRRSYEEAKNEYSLSKEYKEAEKNLEREFFWLIDEYEATVIADYANEKKSFTIVFEVANEQYSALCHNMQECLIAPLKEIYGIPLEMQSVAVRLEDKKVQNNYITP